jgi:hypothetical protein
MVAEMGPDGGAPPITNSITLSKELPMAATRRSMIVRMFRLMNKVMDQMEKNLTISTDKDVDLLGRLVTTLGKLIEIERVAGTSAAPRQDKEMLDIRNKLAQRIAELKRS